MLGEQGHGIDTGQGMFDVSHRHSSELVAQATSQVVTIDLQQRLNHQPGPFWRYVEKPANGARCPFGGCHQAGPDSSRDRLAGRLEDPFMVVRGDLRNALVNKGAVTVHIAECLRQSTGVDAVQAAGVRFCGIAPQRRYHEVALEQPLDSPVQGYRMILQNQSAAGLTLQQVIAAVGSGNPLRVEAAAQLGSLVGQVMLYRGA
ncbi:hypothetical protein D3C78_1087850 [compost metagenome]